MVLPLKLNRVATGSDIKNLCNEHSNHFLARIGQTMKKKYKREMEYVFAVINEMDRKLEKPIRDLDDVRLIMDTLKKIREQEVDIDLKIDPIEVIAFNFHLKK